MNSEDRFRAALKPLFPKLEQIVRGGFNFYFDNYAAFVFRHTPRTRATIINDHIVDMAMQLLTEFGVHGVRLMQRRLFEFNGACILHFKKLDRRKISSNYPTLFALDFNKQLELPGLPATLPRLIVGYVPKRDWSGIESVYVTCPNGNDIEWFIDVSSENLTSATQTSITPPVSNAKPRKGNRKRINRGDDSGDTNAAES